MRTAYISKAFTSDSRQVIRQANDICAEYAAQGYDLTLRQLYYQFVARDLIPNTMRSYKRLGSIVNDARLTGHLDWDFIVDRTRNLRRPPSWNSPQEILRAARDSYFRDRLEGQPYRIEVWVEKDALGGVIERATDDLRIPWFSCRGYVSQSEVYAAAQRFGTYLQAGQIPIILHLGDHDPSGIDMTRDIKDRLDLFMLTDWALAQDWLWELENEPDALRTHIAESIETERSEERTVDETEMPVIVRRIALNWDQIQTYNPPPNPAKLTDARARGYIREHGYESWELDALPPDVLTRLIEDEINDLLDHTVYEAVLAREGQERDAIATAIEGMETE